MKQILALALMSVIVVAGCNEQGEQPETPAKSTVGASEVSANLDLQPTYPAPTYTLVIEKSETDPKQYSVAWTARVNTSGWKMTTENVLIEDSMGKTIARVWIVMHEPQPGDSVTQVAETLAGRHDAGTTQIDKAELSAKHTVRDSKPTYPQTFSVIEQVGG